MSPVLTRSHSTISVDFFSCKALLHSFIPALTRKTHFKANLSSLKGKRFSLKWEINSHVFGIGCLKSKLPSLFCVYALDPVIGLTGIKDNYAISIFSQINNAQPLLKSSAVEAIPAVKSHENAFAMIKREEEEHKKITGIGRAKKGKVPWNKGKKHSPETLARIRERTTQAMQDPKVRQKLVQSRHPHCNSTKARIGASVKLRCEQLRNRKLLQQTCVREWEESIAEAARRGGSGDDELNWNSYETLKAKKKQELLEARKKSIVKVKNKHSHKRGGQSDRHKLKISQAMKAKWTDPVRPLVKYQDFRIADFQFGLQNYRQKHQYGMLKFHGSTPPAFGRKITDGENSLKPGKSLVGEASTINSEALHLVSISKDKAMVKIRTATERARSLIAETEKAAKILEPAATKDLSVRASLYEAHKLLAEAIQSLHKTEAWTSSMETILSRNDVTSINDKSFQPHDCMNNSQLSESELLGHGTVNDVKSRFEESQYTLEQSMHFSAKGISSGKLWTSSNSAFEVQNSGSDNVRMLESKAMENIKSKAMSSIKPISEVFNSPFMVDEHNVEGTVGNLEARTKQKIKMNDRFDEEIKSAVFYLKTSGERSSVKYDLLTSRRRTRRWFRGRLVDIKDE